MMNIVNWKKALKLAVFDPHAGIRIAPLTAEDQEFGLFVTEILPGKKVNAHYHQQGTEIYQIIMGKGTIHTGSPIPEKNKCKDIKSVTVEEGDFFNINSGIAHQLVNTGNKPLILIFGCAPTHLTSDRTLVDDLLC